MLKHSAPDLDSVSEQAVVSLSVWTYHSVYFQCGEMPRVQVLTLQSTSVQESAGEPRQKCQKILHALGVEFPQTCSSTILTPFFFSVSKNLRSKRMIIEIFVQN